MKKAKVSPVRFAAATIEVALIVLLCFLYAGSPPPGKNEPHYLGKAKNYWQPEWCQGDFFYESGDAHELFFWTFGWVTNYLSLDGSAWVGRLLVWILFALSWRFFIQCLLTDEEAKSNLHESRSTNARYAGLLGIVFLLPLIHYGHLAGEWLIGGIEAKGFAYPLVFAAMGFALRSQWHWVWPLLGLASCFHVLIGGWAVIAHFIAWCLRRKEDNLRLIDILPWLVLGGVLALPGLIPAFSLRGDATPQQIEEANITYSFRRLSHHLVFYRFHWSRIASFVVTWTVWWQLGKLNNRPTQERLKAIVIGSLCIAMGGFWLDILLAPLNSVRAAVMRFYWFRLSDVLVPVGIAAALVSCFFRRRDGDSVNVSTSSSQTLPRPVHYLAIACAVVAFAFAMKSDGFGARASSLQQQHWQLTADAETIQEVKLIDDAWLDVCRWVRESDLPSGSLFLTPTRQQTFKWYAHRPDLVTWKDIPQDAASIVEWWSRRGEVHKLGPWPWSNPEELANIVSKYRVTHIVWPASEEYEAKHPVPTDVEQLYRNDVFKVYALPTR